MGDELRGARVDAGIDRADTVSVTERADVVLARAAELRELAVAEAEALVTSQVVRADEPLSHVLLGAHDATNLAEEPRIDRRELVEPLVGDAEAHRVRDVEEAVGRRRPDDLLERARDGSGVVHLERARGPSVELRRIHAEVARLLRLGEREVVHPSDERLEPVLPGLERARRFLDRFAERSPEAHHLADALHLRSERRLGAGELLEGEPRPLRDHVVDDRLERGARPRDVVP